MKKSDQKLKTRNQKNAANQRRHLKSVLSDKQRKETREQFKYDRMFKATVELNAHDERIKEELKKNIEILAALEREYDAEQEAKKALNKELDGQGCDTLKEKLDHLQGQSKSLEECEQQLRDTDKEGVDTLQGKLDDLHVNSQSIDDDMESMCDRKEYFDDVNF